MTLRERLGQVDRRRARRVAVLLGVAGSILVIVAIPTDSAPIVGVGASLIALAHILYFLSDFVRPARRRELDSYRGEDESRDQRFRSDWS